MNLGYFTLGLTILSGSIYFYLNEKSIFIFDLFYYSFSNNFIQLSVFIWLFLPLGILLFLFGIFGCSIIYRKSTCGKVIFGILNFILFGGVLTILLLLRINYFDNTLDNSILNYLNEIELDETSLGEDLFESLETYQTENACCGVNSVDFCYNWITGIPESCSCVVADATENTCSDFPKDICNYSNSTARPYDTIWPDSCSQYLLDDLEDYLIVVNIVCYCILGVASFSVLFLLISCCGKV